MYICIYLYIYTVEYDRPSDKYYQVISTVQYLYKYNLERPY